MVTPKKIKNGLCNIKQLNESDTMKHVHSSY